MSKVLSILKEGTGDRVSVSVSPQDKVSKTLSDVSSYWELHEPHVFELDGEMISTHMTWSNVSFDHGEVLILRPSDDPNRLPEEIWEQRILNEVKSLKNDGYSVSCDSSENRFDVEVTLKNIPGPVLIGDMIANSFKHKLSLSLARAYPYVAPRVKWQSQIYHPNIAPPERGGDIHCEYLSSWSFSHGISKLINELVYLLENPEFDNTLDHRECIDASRRIKMIKEGKI